MKKILMSAAALILALACITGCGGKTEIEVVTSAAAPSEKESAAESASGEETAADNESEAAIETEAETKAAKVSHTADEYREAKVDELNGIPILMYHRIYDMKNSETEYTGGNVDADGYNRTAEAFEADLEQFYEWGYRCMRLTDYIDGKIDVPFGYSPVILTFDDGIQEAHINGFDSDGNPIWADNSALAVLERVKERHPDFNVTATFFLNVGLFENGDKDPQLMKWMVDHGYDIGNHTAQHPMLSSCSAEEIEKEVGSIYKKLEEIIPGQYVNIVALPYGDPTDVKGDPKYQKILSGTYEGFKYTTKGTLLCSWEYGDSPFINKYDNTYIKRIRGYDNNGTNFDIEYNFGRLNEGGRRYISDGNPDTVVIRAEDKDEWLGETYGLELITY